MSVWSLRAGKRKRVRRVRTRRFHENSIACGACANCFGRSGARLSRHYLHDAQESPRCWAHSSHERGAQHDSAASDCRGSCSRWRDRIGCGGKKRSLAAELSQNWPTTGPAETARWASAFLGSTMLLRLYDLIAYCVSNQFTHSMQLQFAHDVGAVYLGRLYANVQ